VKAAAASVNRRGQDVTAHRHFRKTAGAIIAVTVVTATASLAASSPGGATPTHNAADTLPPSKPNYLLPVGTLVSNGSLPQPTLAGDTGTKGVPAGTPPVPTTNTSPVDPSIQNYGGGAGTLTPVGIATLALEAGCSAAAAPTATAVSMAESGGSPSAQGDITLMTAQWDWSAGLWQIRGLRAERGTGGLRDSVANQNAVSNAAAMYTISNGCTDWTPWTTYNVGIYQQYLSVAQNAVDFVLAYQRAHGGAYPAVAPPDPTAVIPVGGSGGAAGPAQPQAAQSGAAHPSSAPKATKPTRAAGSAAAPGTPRSSGAPQPAASSAAPAGPAAPATSAAPLPKLSLPNLLPSSTPKILPSVAITPPTLPVPLPTITLPKI
jgi:hypothetical protein